MIRVSVLTEIEFENEEHLDRYLTGDEVAIVTGFSNEIRTAYKNKCPVHFETPRLQFGFVTKSEICCFNIEELGEKEV